MYRQVISDSPLEAASIPMNCRMWSWHHHTSYVMEGDVARLWLLRSVNAPQNWLIEEFYMVRCERQCMNLEENQSAKFTKVVTAAEHTRYTLLHCMFWIMVVFSDMLSTLLVQVLSTAGIFDLHTRLLGKWHPKWMKQSNPTTTTLFSWRQRREASLSDGRELTTRYWDCIVFMSNIWLGVEEIRSIQLFVRECSNVRPFRTWSLKRETFTKLSPTRSTVPWQPWHRAIWMTLLAGYE